MATWCPLCKGKFNPACTSSRCKFEGNCNQTEFGEGAAASWQIYPKGKDDFELSEFPEEKINGKRPDPDELERASWFSSQLNRSGSETDRKSTVPDFHISSNSPVLSPSPVKKSTLDSHSSSHITSSGKLGAKCSEANPTVEYRPVQSSESDVDLDPNLSTIIQNRSSTKSDYSTHQQPLHHERTPGASGLATNGQRDVSTTVGSDEQQAGPARSAVENPKRELPYPDEDHHDSVDRQGRYMDSSRPKASAVSSLPPVAIPSVGYSQRQGQPGGRRPATMKTSPFKSQQALVNHTLHPAPGSAPSATRPSMLRHEQIQPSASLDQLPTDVFQNPAFTETPSMDEAAGSRFLPSWRTGQRSPTVGHSSPEAVDGARGSRDQDHSDTYRSFRDESRFEESESGVSSHGEMGSDYVSANEEEQATQARAPSPVNEADPRDNATFPQKVKNTAKSGWNAMKKVWARLKKSKAIPAEEEGVATAYNELIQDTQSSSTPGQEVKTCVEGVAPTPDSQRSSRRPADSGVYKSIDNVIGKKSCLPKSSPSDGNDTDETPLNSPSGENEAASRLSKISETFDSSEQTERSSWRDLSRVVKPPPNPREAVPSTSSVDSVVSSPDAAESSSANPLNPSYSSYSADDERGPSDVELKMVNAMGGEGLGEEGVEGGTIRVEQKHNFSEGSSQSRTDQNSSAEKRKKPKKERKPAKEPNSSSSDADPTKHH